jgi:hypothetical protein
MTKNSFVLRTSYTDIFSEMSDEQAGALIKAIFHYVATKEVSAGLNDAELKMAFKFIRRDIDYDSQKYDALCAKRSLWGKQGAQAKAGISRHDDSDVVVDVVSDSESEKEKEKEKKEKNFSASFQKPTLSEVEQYCAQRGGKINAQTFFDFYEAKGWMMGNNPIHDWRAALRTWENKQAPHHTDPPPRAPTVQKKYLVAYRGKDGNVYSDWVDEVPQGATLVETFLGKEDENGP